MIENIEQEPASALLADDAADKLTAMLAPYLERYPNVSVEFRARKLDPGKLQEHRAEYELDSPEAAYGPLKLIVIEWNRRFPREFLAHGAGQLGHRPPNAVVYLAGPRRTRAGAPTMTAPVSTFPTR